jgi:hypothetical protein
LDAVTSPRDRRREIGFAVGGAAAALAHSLAMWGFTVDDALISVRYAQSIASGAGWRPSPGAAVSDGVTPLPWAPLLALLSDDDALVVLFRAKVLGVALWTIAAARLGAAIGARTSPSWGDRAARPWAAVAAIGLLAAIYPLGAHAASGMETGLVIALATAAATSRHLYVCACIAGLAAAFRPELVGWAAALSVLRALFEGEGASAERARSSIAALGLSCGPFVLVAIVRAVAFGRAAPLAATAKPSDLSHGLVYALAAFVVTAAPVALVAPRALAASRSPAAPIALATAAHFAVLAGVGGDWMPYARLATPVIPAAIYAFVVSSAPAHARTWSVALRLGLAAAAAAVSLRAAPAGRGVMRDRTALVASARAPLAGARCIAALDVGWVGAAAPHARIVDLAGVTDPTVAALPGGHTSKRVDLGMLAVRHVDALVLLAPPREVERRLRGDPQFTAKYTLSATLELGRTGVYFVWTRR